MKRNSIFLLVLIFAGSLFAQNAVDYVKKWEGRNTLIFEKGNELWDIYVNEYAVTQMIEETEKLFGKGLFHEVFKENYKLNPNFVPDVSLIQTFYEQIMPIVETIFKKQQKYSPAKKGNH